MADAQKALVEARMKFVAAHASLMEAYEVTNKDPWDCDEPSARTSEPTHLSVVS
jgi:hypothetical protein